MGKTGRRMEDGKDGKDVKDVKDVKDGKDGKVIGALASSVLLRK
jgi:hypothetical protein